MSLGRHQPWFTRVELPPSLPILAPWEAACASRMRCVRQSGFWRSHMVIRIDRPLVRAKVGRLLCFEVDSAKPANSPLSEKFIACLESEAEIVKNSNDDVTPMIAQARAIIWLDTLARLHDAGLQEAIKAADAEQASAWTRDLALLEIVMGLLRNIQPMDLDTPDIDELPDVTIS